LITLQDEVQALQDYIFLMQTRFEDKISVRWYWGAGTQVLSYVGGAVVLLFLALMVWNGRERLAAAR
jgi:hypothetical protein